MQLSPLPPRNNVAPLVIPEDVPVYRLKTACFMEDTFFPEDSVVIMEDTPSRTMQPLNKMAYDKMVKYLTTLDDMGALIEKQSGKRYVPVLPAFLASYDNAHSKKKIMRIDSPEAVPLMGAKKKGQLKARKIESETDAPLSVLGNSRTNLNLSVDDRGVA